MGNKVEKKQLDYEWIELIMEARAIGLTLEQISLFLEVAKKT